MSIVLDEQTEQRLLSSIRQFFAEQLHLSAATRYGVIMTGPPLSPVPPSGRFSAAQGR